MNRQIVLKIALLFFLFIGKVSAQDRVRVESVEAFNNAVSQAQPGTTIVLANGVWQDAELLLEGKGTADAPIKLTVEEKGKVTLEGQSYLQIAGEFLHVEGLVFKNGYTPTNEVISFRKNSKQLANNSRLTNCLIDNYSNPERHEQDSWVALYGKNNRVDHNHFEGKGNRGVTLIVRLNSKESIENNHVVESNYFGPRQKSTTANSSYSRTELREQMVAGSDHTNWTFAQGGYMRGVLSVPEVSTAENGKPHKVIIMQIHGRLTDEQRDLIGEDDNNAPPMLKIYWNNGRVRIKTKVVKNLNATYEELLHESAWGDDEGYTIPIDVGHDKFTLEVIVSDGSMEIIFNDLYSIMYNSIHIQKWGIFENYFKAGNYFQTRDKGSFSRVKYYELEVSHD